MGKLNHFYMINSNCSSYHLLKNVRSEYFSPENFDSNKEFHFCDIDEFQKKIKIIGNIYFHINRKNII